MEKTYDEYIGVAPGYESVVAIDNDSDEEFWTKYIVNKDMVNAVSALNKTLKAETEDDSRHIWMQGAYGTGKTYAAIVIKRLLSADYGAVQNFMENRLFDDVRSKFLSIRKKKCFYVEFKNAGCKQLDTPSKFLFEIENLIRKIVSSDKDLKFVQTKSLIDTVQRKVKEFKSTLKEKFDDNQFTEYWQTEDSFESFYDKVQSGDLNSCKNAVEILMSLNIGLAVDINTFSEWLMELFEANTKLKENGIFIIWDEFTEYAKRNDLTVIESLSRLCKQLPFYVMYITHSFERVDTDFKNFLNKSEARFHTIHINLMEETTLKLISDSIQVKQGMEEPWEDVQSDLCDSFESNLSNFFIGQSEDLSLEDLKKIFPIHPMTINVVSIIGNKAASNRSIFKFLKSSDDDGFKSFIKSHHPNEWVTIDYLWDYYYVNNHGGNKEITADTEDSIRHYNKMESSITDPKVLRVFKAAVLLLATVGSAPILRRSRENVIRATEKTIIKCFDGEFLSKFITDSLNILCSDTINALKITEDRDDRRLELPYYGSEDELEKEVAKLKREETISSYFNTNGIIGSKIISKFTEEDKAILKRTESESCWGTSQNISQKISLFNDKLSKDPSLFGILFVAPPIEEKKNFPEVYTTALEKIKQYLTGEYSDRLLVVVLKKPMDLEGLDKYYHNRAQEALAIKSNNLVNAKNSQKLADVFLETWTAAAIMYDLTLVCVNKNPIPVTGQYMLYDELESVIFKKYPYSLEKIIKTNTLYKKSLKGIPELSIRHISNDNKSEYPDISKRFDTKWSGVVDLLKRDKLWDCTLDTIYNAPESEHKQCVIHLLDLIKNEITSGSTEIDELWGKIQSELGYYATSITSYYIGFVFRFFLDKYTWHDGNNSQKMDAEHAPVLIELMCDNRAHSMKITSESESERNFKDKTCRLFRLDPSHNNDLDECKKNLRAKILRIGAPFWALKYDNISLDCDKNVFTELVVDYNMFIQSQYNSIELVQKILKELQILGHFFITQAPKYFDESSNYQNGLVNFIHTNCKEINDSVSSGNYSEKNVLSILTSYMEEEKYQWTEEKVVSELAKVYLDLELIKVTSDGFKEWEFFTVEKVKTTLFNYFSNLKVPLCVYESAEEEWFGTIEYLVDISLNKWIGFDNETKQSIIEAISKNIGDVVYNLQFPVFSLKKYLRKNGMGSLSDADCQDVLASLPNEGIFQKEPAFKNLVKSILSELELNRKIDQLKEQWLLIANNKPIDAWIREKSLPIEWVLPDKKEMTDTLLRIVSNKSVSNESIDHALIDIKSGDYGVLQNNLALDEIFLENVSSKEYIDALSPYVSDIKKTIRDKGYRDPQLWSQNIVKIRDIVKSFMMSDLKHEIFENAKKRIEGIKKGEELQKILLELLEQSPEACMTIMSKLS